MIIKRRSSFAVLIVIIHNLKHQHMKVFQFLMLFLMAGAVAQAQTTTTEKKAKVRTERKQMHKQMHDELNLTADQKAQLKAIHEKQKAEMTAIKNNSSISAEQKK
jgi:Spy/CpxP family protein refolding chaperone